MGDASRRGQALERAFNSPDLWKLFRFWVAPSVVRGTCEKKLGCPNPSWNNYLGLVAIGPRTSAQPRRYVRRLLRCAPWPLTAPAICPENQPFRSGDCPETKREGSAGDSELSVHPNFGRGRVIEINLQRPLRRSHVCQRLRPRDDLLVPIGQGIAVEPDVQLLAPTTADAGQNVIVVLGEGVTEDEEAVRPGLNVCSELLKALIQVSVVTNLRLFLSTCSLCHKQRKCIFGKRLSSLVDQTRNQIGARHREGTSH